MILNSRVIVNMAVPYHTHPCIYPYSPRYPYHLYIHVYTMTYDPQTSPIRRLHAYLPPISSNSRETHPLIPPTRSERSQYTLMTHGDGTFRLLAPITRGRAGGWAEMGASGRGKMVEMSVTFPRVALQVVIERFWRLEDGNG